MPTPSILDTVIFDILNHSVVIKVIFLPPMKERVNVLNKNKSQEKRQSEIPHNNAGYSESDIIHKLTKILDVKVKSTLGEE